MQQSRVRSGYWFRPRRYGIGATPVTWQGWMTVAILVTLLFADRRWVAAPAQYLVAGLLIVSFGALIAALTEDGWRWRWGDAR